MARPGGSRPAPCAEAGVRLAAMTSWIPSSLVCSTLVAGAHRLFDHDRRQRRADAPTPVAVLLAGTRTRRTPRPRARSSAPGVSRWSASTGGSRRCSPTARTRRACLGARRAGAAADLVARAATASPGSSAHERHRRRRRDRVAGPRGQNAIVTRRRSCPTTSRGVHRATGWRSSAPAATRRHPCRWVCSTSRVSPPRAAGRRGLAVLLLRVGARRAAGARARGLRPPRAGRPRRAHQAVTSRPGLFATPAWSADGRTVVYAERGASGTQRLVAVVGRRAAEVARAGQGRDLVRAAARR